MAAISRMTLSSALSWLKIIAFQLKFYWNLIPGGPIDNVFELLNNDLALNE